ncbi:hypothetical protein TNCV_511881 [Trichonephila clavipes]|nr:hypothetical protein TNCV_511881 [Trichonephila clavipes]
MSFVCGLRPRPTTGVVLAPCHDEFLSPRSDYFRKVALETTTHCRYNDYHPVTVFIWQTYHPGLRLTVAFLRDPHPE